MDRIKDRIESPHNYLSKRESVKLDLRPTWERSLSSMLEQPAWTSMSQLESEAWQKLSSTEKGEALKNCLEELKSAKIAFDQFEEQVTKNNIPQAISLEGNKKHINEYLEQVYKKSVLLLAEIDNEGSTNLENQRKDADYIRYYAIQRKDDKFTRDIRWAQDIYQRCKAGEDLIVRFDAIKKNSSDPAFPQFKEDFAIFQQENYDVQNYTASGVKSGEQIGNFTKVWKGIEDISTKMLAMWE